MTRRERKRWKVQKDILPTATPCVLPWFVRLMGLFFCKKKKPRIAAETISLTFYVDGCESDCTIL